MRITENDVVARWEPYVRTAVCRWAHNLDGDDRYQAGMIGLLYAIRTYECRMIPFKDYLDICLRRFVEAEAKRQREQRRAEARLSLDMRKYYDGGRAVTYQDCIADTRNCFEDADTRIFAASLCERDRGQLRQILIGARCRRVSKTLTAAIRTFVEA